MPNQVASACHARVVPSLVVPKLGQALKGWDGPIEPAELLRWSRPAEPTDALRRELRTQIITRLRARSTWMWAQPTSVTLPVDWEHRLAAGDVVALRKVVSAGDLHQLTMREVRDRMQAPLERVLGVLARVEALDWLPPPARGKPRRASESSLPESSSDLRGLADHVLALPWLAAVAPHDLRFGYPQEAQSLSGWIREHMRQPRVSGAFATRLRALAAADKLNAAAEARELLIAAGEICLPRLLSEAHDRWIAMAMHRHICPSGESRTLQEVGDKFGLTRERVRQICGAFEQVFAEAQLVAPALDRTLAAVARIAPCSTGEANEQLARYMGEGAGIECLLQWFQTLGRGEPPLCRQRSLTKMRGQAVEVVVIEAQGSEPWVRAMIRHVGRDTMMFGCTNVLRIAGLLAFEPGVAPGRESIEQALQSAAGFHWLDREAGWFTLGDSDNCSAASRVRKIMAVARHHVGADEIAAALASDDLLIYRETNSLGLATPPVHVLRELMRRWPWLKLVQRGRFQPGPGFTPDDVLSEPEQLAVRVIEANQGVACRFEVADAITEQLKVTSELVSLMLGSSPIIQRVEHGLYRLIGQRVGDAAVEGARLRLRQNADQHPIGLTKDGMPMFRVRVTAAALLNEQYHIPERFRHQLGGQRFDVVDPEGAAVGKARVLVSGKLIGLNQLFPAARAGDLYHIEVLGQALSVKWMPAAP